MRRPRRAARRGDRLGVALIGLAFVVLAALAAAGLALRPPPTDPDTLCRTDAPIAAHTVVLVDATDRLEPRHRRRLEATVRQEAARLEPHQRLTIMALRAARPQEPRILFSKCLPPDGSRTNPLFANPRQAQERWDASVGQALTGAVRRAGGGGLADSSPILAGLRAVAADPDFGADIPQRRLVLVSDLLEHETRGFSLYSETADFRTWQADPANRPADLEAVDIRVTPLDRPDHAARQARAQTFWEQYFDAAGARRVRFDPAP